MSDSIIPKSTKTPEDFKNQMEKLDKELFNRLNKDPCIEEDCEDLLSPCCNAVLETVFNSLPLEVSCIKCREAYVLRELIK